MAKYLLSRFMIVFYIGLFYGIISNIGRHMNIFFSLYEKGIFYYIIFFLLLVLWIGIAVIVINATYSLLTKVENIGFEKLINEITLENIQKFFRDFFKVLGRNFWHEVEREKHEIRGIFFLIIVILYVSLVNGSPLLNNYYGIYKSYSLEEGGKNGKFSDTYYLIHKNKSELIEKYMKTLEYGYKKGDLYDESDLAYEYEKYYTVEKKGYLFYQAGLIDGFRTKYDYKGLLSYFQCILLYGVEKLITTTIYFLLPFFLTLIYSIRRYKE